MYKVRIFCGQFSSLRQIFQEILNILFECSLLEFEYSFPIHNYWSRVPEPASRRSFLGGSARAWQSREWRRSSSPDRRPSRCHIFALTRKKERLIAGYAWRSLIDNQLRQTLLSLAVVRSLANMHVFG